MSPSRRDIAINRDPNTLLRKCLSLLRLLMAQVNRGLGIDAKVTLFTRLVLGILPASGMRKSEVCELIPSIKG